jgi:glycosyltransferase involved in cell wall biosynthesis
MTRLIIQIPCYNEAEWLPETLRQLPRDLPGVSEIQWLVIDDGSSDQTSEVARAHGVDHVVRHARNQGLARAFATGLDECVRLGADIIVNTDADNQYSARDIPKLIEPILRGDADLVVGARPIASIRHFSLAKRILQKIGSYVVRLASGTTIPDAPSGFRAMSRRTAMRLHVLSAHTYTLETIIQAGRQGLTVVSVPIRVNEFVRPSRLISSTLGYVGRSAMTILRIFLTYRPLLFFAAPGLVSLAAGTVLGARFLVFYFGGQGDGHVQSLILAAILLVSGGLLIVLGLLADLISVNRRLLERMDLHIREAAARVKHDG